jgi:acyl dehydratase
VSTTLDFEELRAATGRDLGQSQWIHVDQPRIDTFADVIDDHQWIHVDPEQAKESPYGGTIAHGYLTLAVAATRLGDLLQVRGAASIVNYGVDRVRFPAALPAGSRIRAQATITQVEDVTGGLLVRARITAAAEGIAKPVCVADVCVIYLFGPGPTPAGQ